MSRFIAEVSSNHAADLDRSREFIRTAARIGCGAVKFQLFRVDRLFAPEILERSPEHRRRSEWELPPAFLPDLAACCREQQIAFGCSPFYLEAVEELEPHVDFFKIASYELLWDELLAECAATGLPVILSTGMAEMEEIVHAAGVLKKHGCEDPLLLHCTSAYPTPHEQANLAAIRTIREETGCRAGWSDHTVEPGVIHRAVHRWGAEAVEFHLDLEGEGEEYEAGHCWLPGEIAPVIRAVRRGLEADGDGAKGPVPSEEPDRAWRADPGDGLRPLKHVREEWKKERPKRR